MPSPVNGSLLVSKARPPMPLGVVELVNPIARAARSEEIAAPVEGGHGRTMSDDFQAVVAGLRGGLQKLVGAAQQLCRARRPTYSAQRSELRIGK